LPINKNLICSNRKQRTLQKTAIFSGIGLHTGKEAKMSFVPAPENTGIIFHRKDIPNAPEIPANVEYVKNTARSTNIGIADTHIHTVEHVLAALSAYQIDNLRIEIFGPEPPIGSGNSEPFVTMIEDSGILEQDAIRYIVGIKEPVYWSNDETHLVVLPYDGYRISYTLHYPGVAAIGSQFFSLDVNSENFKKEISPCRTFAKYEEISYLIDKGLIKGGSLDNAVIIKNDVILSKEGLKFPDEMVRHKILDLIGDLSLTGFSFHGHVISIRSGHPSNVAFAKELFNYVMGD